MIQLTPDESRVLGVLIEKAFTTPDQYPLTLNATMNGANQKNNRDPVTSLEENQVFDALEALRGKGLVIRADMAGSRVNKFKHHTGDTLHMRPAEVAIMAELLLRGPQTLGELRGRASRMHPFESTESVKQMLTALMEREEPLVTEMKPAPGSRAERYAQLLCPAAHALQADDQAETPVSPAPAPRAADELTVRVKSLEEEVGKLRAALVYLAMAMGEADPFAAQPTPQKTQII